MKDEILDPIGMYDTAFGSDPLLYEQILNSTLPWLLLGGW